MKNISSIIKAISTQKNYDEPPTALLERIKTIAKKVFDGWYDVHDETEFEKILDFIARYEIGRIRTVEDSPSDAAKHWGIVGKHFSKPKGLFLYGPCGTGKTTAARIISEMFDMPMFDMADMTLNYMGSEGEDWLRDFVQSNKRKTIIIDDLGSERKISRYGNESPFGDVIHKRSTSYEWYDVTTIYTSNADSPDKIREWYGPRIESRLLGTCTGVFIGGHDHRHQTPPPR